MAQWAYHLDGHRADRGAFLLSGLVHLAIIDTPLNILSFRLSNIFFSLAAGILLLGVGAYGRLVGSKPPDNPYRRTQDEDNAEHAIAPDDPHLAGAERAVAADTATPKQQREVHLSAIQRHTRQYNQAGENFAHNHSRDETAELRKLERTESAYPERASREERGR